MTELEPRLARPAAAEHRADSSRPRALRFTLRGIIQPSAALAGLFLFVFALQIIKAGAHSLVPLLDGLNVTGPLNAVGFGWLLAYGALSGSPVAAIGITLLAGGVLSESEAFGVVGGSRLGASFIVLAVGFVLYLRHKRNADGLYIGVVALLTTFTTQGPAIGLGLVSLHYGWLDGISFHTPTMFLDLMDAIYGEPVGWISDALPGGLVFAAGVGVLLGSFMVFDRALPQLEAGGDRFSRATRLLNRRGLMFLLGCAVTSVTLSVSISLTLLVPLSLKGYLKREHVIPYVMGANITTFIDTLAGALLLGGQSAFTVVLTEMLSVAAVSGVLLTAFYHPYSRMILAGAHWTTSKHSHLALFLGAIVAVPVLLLLF